MANATFDANTTPPNVCNMPNCPATSTPIGSPRTPKQLEVELQGPNTPLSPVIDPNITPTWATFETTHNETSLKPSGTFEQLRITNLESTCKTESEASNYIRPDHNRLQHAQMLPDPDAKGHNWPEIERIINNFTIEGVTAYIMSAVQYKKGLMDGSVNLELQDWGNYSSFSDADGHFSFGEMF